MSRPTLFQAVLLACCLALLTFGALASEHDDWLLKMQPITPKGYLCRRANTPVVIDGNLDDAAWNAAEWTDDFADIRGADKTKPRFRTRAKMLWDDEYLYIAAEIEEPHVWATLTNHDSVIFHDPDFEVFIDPKGETQPYYEFEMNALNTTWDLLLDKPYMDGGKPYDEWEIPGAKTAVKVHGTINDPSDTDKGWTVEIAFPWKVLSEHARHAGPPKEGEQWRMNFSRVEWQITHANGAYQKVPNTPEDNWVWSPQGVVDMHRPEMWGRVEFTSKPANEKVEVAPLPDIGAREIALEVYYAQRDFWATNNHWATNFSQLNIDTHHLKLRINLQPAISNTADGYACKVESSESPFGVWQIRQDRLLMRDGRVPLESEKFVSAAADKYGDAGRRAAFFLVDNMPPGDRATLSCDFLMENLGLAFEARTNVNFPWAKQIPERIFVNDVLPCASLDEPRDRWRADFCKIAPEIVRDCKTATDAAQALNRELFKRINVHYNTARKRNNQSPKESIEQSKATCTGLSIILADACRAVGVPARIVGVPEWVNKEGNHTWVEIWDGDWFFTGADEYDKDGMNRAWFNKDAALTARSTNALNQIYASSWRRTGTYFPLSWDLDSRAVPAVNVSARYAALEADTNTTEKVVHVRLFEKDGGERLAADITLISADGRIFARERTRAGTADMNDMPELKLPGNAQSIILRFTRGGESREKVLQCSMCAKSGTFDYVWSELTPVPASILSVEEWLARPAAERTSAPDIAFSREDSRRMISLAWNELCKSRESSAANELSAKKIVIGGNSLKWLEKTFGDAPDGRHSLWITLHGGGQGTEEENDLNWKGYFGRYEFAPGSINVAPRAPANTWDLWHVKWVDELLDRLIADMVLKRGVDPDRAYLIGYSAGGDGVYQLAPRMADRFAAAAMCAGHPNSVTPEGLRNLPFFLYMGSEDAAYNRNTVGREFSAKMDALQAADSEGYWHRLTVFPGLPHSMQNREAEMIPRMTSLKRNDWPKRVVWMENDGFVHNRFYWLQRAAMDDAKAGEVVAAHVEGQTITIESPASGQLVLRLSDELVDLDKPVKVVTSGKTIFEGNFQRSFAAVVQSLREREDPQTVATALLPVSW